MKPRYFVSYFWTVPAMYASGHGNLPDMKFFKDGKPTTIAPEHIPGAAERAKKMLAEQGLSGATVVITGWERYETDAE